MNYLKKLNIFQINKPKSIYLSFKSKQVTFEFDDPTEEYLNMPPVKKKECFTHDLQEKTKFGIYLQDLY